MSRIDAIELIQALLAWAVVVGFVLFGAVVVFAGVWIELCRERIPTVLGQKESDEPPKSTDVN